MRPLCRHNGAMGPGPFEKRTYAGQSAPFCMARQKSNSWETLHPAAKIATFLLAPPIIAWLLKGGIGFFVAAGVELIVLAAAIAYAVRTTGDFKHVVEAFLDAYSTWVSKWQDARSREQACERKTPPLTGYQRTSLKRQVGFQCEIPRCREETHLEVHHIKPRSETGPNIPSNLLVLCRNHHAQCGSGGFSRQDQKQLAQRPGRFHSQDFASKWVSRQATVADSSA